MSDKPVYRVKAVSDSLPRFAKSLDRSGYRNEMSGLGTSRDKGAQGAFTYGHLDIHQIDAAYRTSWLAKKGVDTPVHDMLRQGWTHGLEGDVKNALQKEWRRLEGDKHNRQAMIWARLHGGAAVYIGTNDENLSEPLNIDAIEPGGVTYLTSIPRYYLSAVAIETDPISPAFGSPKHYQVASSSQGGQPIHHSRIVRYIGNERTSLIGTVHDFWGDSVLEPVFQTLLDFAAGQRGIANILQEASLDVWSMKGLMSGLASGENYVDALKGRVQIAMDLKSTLNALILDSEDEYDKKPANFANLDKIGMMHLRLVAASFGMPVTKFLGEAPQGMNATGEGDERNYYDMISSQQETSLRPCLDKLYGAIMPSAGVAPDVGDLRFNPLRQMSEKDRVANAKTKAETLDIYARGAFVPDGVQAAAARAALESDDDIFNGVKDAYKAYTDDDGMLLGAQGVDASPAEI